MLANVVAGYQANGLPLDVLWSDIDYMLQFEDFTLDTSRYSLQAFSNFTATLHSQGRRYVPIIDAGVASRPYLGYERGLNYSVFIRKDNTTQDPFIGLVWPGKSVWVDFFHPNSSVYWTEMLDVLHQQVDFDGIWLDMNEASSFCDGECSFTSTSLPPPDLPFVPGNHSLQDQLLPLRAQHYGGSDFSEFNTHALFGTMETQATYTYLANATSERPFILSRSSVPGHGVYGAHWLGDNYSQWTQLRYSVTGVFNFQLFGVPLVGADVCGFHNNTTPELCARWLQLGAFYPFMRNHNDIGSAPQELYALGTEVQEVGAAAVRLRYSLHYYLYTQLFSVALAGGSVFKPMFFEFPDETDLYANQEQFMSGPALMVLPVLYEGATSVTGYLPNNTLWYDFFTGEQESQTGWQTFPAPLNTIKICMRGGYALPYVSAVGAVTLGEIRQRSVQIKVALDVNNTASGFYYVDDGLSLDTISSGNYSKYLIQVSPAEDSLLEVRIEPEQSKYRAAGHFISDIWIYGLKTHVSRVSGVTGKVASVSPAVVHLEVKLSAAKPNRLVIS
jgi:alpha-glucosidase (family GH31 glycosyl hydrolase)